VREDPQLQFEQVQLETTEGMSEQAALRQLSAQCQGQSEGMSEQEAVWQSTEKQTESAVAPYTGSSSVDVRVQGRNC